MMAEMQTTELPDDRIEFNGGWICPKCGSEGPKMEYAPAMNDSTFWFYGERHDLILSDKEHLRVSCSRCDFTVAMRCIGDVA